MANKRTLGVAPLDKPRARQHQLTHAKRLPNARIIVRGLPKSHRHIAHEAHPGRLVPIYCVSGITYASQLATTE